LQFRYRQHFVVVSSLLLLTALILTGCGGTSHGSSPTTDGSRRTGHLTINPSTMAFGNVALGSSASQTGSLTASGSSISVSSANLNGAGYTLSGISFPATIAAGQSVPFTVTFSPSAAGNSSGNISFVSRFSTSNTETLSGSGMQPAPHSVSLSWDPSTSAVTGYNVYRGTRTGGPYTRLNSALEAGTQYSDTNVQSGATYFYVVTALDASSQESGFSNETMAVMPTW
jgi:hypothetical protein